MVKFSVIIPVYNAAEFLPRTFGSILSQDIDKELYEVIVVDDGSTDTSREIIQSFELQFPHFQWLSQDNRGVSAARNRALDLVSGEYVLFLDADDTFNDDALLQVKQIVEGHDADIFFFENGYPSRPVQYSPDGFLSKVNFSVYIWKTCIRYHLIRLNNIRFVEGYILEDGVFLLEIILKASKILTFRLDPVTYNNNTKSLMRDFSDKKKNSAMIASFIFVINAYQKIIDENRASISEQACTNLIERKEYFIYFMILRMVRYKWSNKRIAENLKKVHFTTFTVFPGIQHRKRSYKLLAKVIENRFLRSVLNAAYRKMK